jgi:hypothetical protein
VEEENKVGSVMHRSIESRLATWLSLMY